MLLRQNFNSSGKSSLVALKWDRKLNFTFCDIRRVLTDSIKNGLVPFNSHVPVSRTYSTLFHHNITVARRPASPFSLLIIDIKSLNMALFDAIFFHRFHRILHYSHSFYFIYSFYLFIWILLLSLFLISIKINMLMQGNNISLYNCDNQSCQHCILQSARFSSPIRKIFYTIKWTKMSRIRKVVKFVCPDWFIFPENQKVFCRIKKGWQLWTTYATF